MNAIEFSREYIINRDGFSNDTQLIVDIFSEEEQVVGHNNPGIHPLPAADKVQLSRVEDLTPWGGQLEWTDSFCEDDVTLQGEQLLVDVLAEGG